MLEFAEPEDTVTIHYRASTRDGGVIEDTHSRHPLQLSLDDPRYHQELRRQIVGMSPGESKAILLDAEQCFGLRDHRRQLTVPASCLTDGIQKGDQLVVELAGADVNVWIIDVNNDEVTLDCNHPLVGESLELNIQLLEVHSPEEL